MDKTSIGYMRQQMRKNMFMHADFNPALTDKEAQFLLHGLYSPNQQLDKHYNNINDFIVDK